MGVEIKGEIEKVNGKELSYNEFVDRYLAKNQPVVLTGLMDNWRACKDWVIDDDAPNLHFFSTHFGKSKVQEYPEYVAYRTPLFFSDDWLNLYLDHHRMHKNPDVYQESNEICCSDYRFVYMGAKGSWTPLHADVFRSYSWSANICGKKKWVFLSPSQCHLVYDRNMKNTVYNIFDDVSETQFPGFKKAIWLECIQNQNEIIFVPSGWYHQVHNLEDTISINHNWFNAYNLSWVWDLLLRDYREAKEYIEDIKDICDDFEGVCQRNLAANTGMNFTDFLIFLARFFLANVVQLYGQHGNNEIANCKSSKMTQQLAVNLASIQEIVHRMRSIEGVQGNDRFLDMKKILNDPKFVKQCSDMGRIYSMIHEQQQQESRNRDAEEVLAADFMECCSSSVCTLDDFVKFVDFILAKFGNF
ncbi:arginine-specific demethylase JMJ20 isoform X2 [Mercurialis annua]|uniref:arginine-specific demethylase JMJ20 isoform X2 n=1 Tax=Mercurialis annua TaxID=3986 RepID=UPI002160D7F8|nr:arginine-specific demethylase JMJ20 isoform X2 [Mercurialis annua]